MDIHLKRKISVHRWNPYDTGWYIQIWLNKSIHLLRQVTRCPLYTGFSWSSWKRQDNRVWKTSFLGRMHFALIPALCPFNANGHFEVTLETGGTLSNWTVYFLGVLCNSVMVGKRTTPKKVPCCNSTQHCPPSHGQPVTPHTFCCARSSNAGLWEIWCVLCLCMQQ